MKPRDIVGITGGLLILAALLLGWWVAGEPREADRWIFGRVAQAWTPFWLALTRLGDRDIRTAIGLVIAVWLVWRGWRWHAIVLVATVTLETLTVEGLKALLGRERPELLPHLDIVTSLSYPSGHSSHNMTLYLLTGLFVAQETHHRWPLAIGALAALLIGVSRVVLGVHWPSDVLGGWLAGAGFALIGWSLTPRARGTYGRAKT